METNKFKSGDRVEWFWGRYSIIKNYGTIITVAKNTAKIKNDNGDIERVKLRQLNWI